MRRAVALVAALLAAPLPAAFALAGGDGSSAPTTSAVASVHTVDGQLDDWIGESSLVAGSTQVSAGEFIYQDFIYDDTGAGVATRSANAGRGNGATTFGTYRYPTAMERYRSNAADLFQFRATSDGERAHFLVWLNTLVEPDTTVVGIGIGSPSTEAALEWPFGARLQTPSEHVLTVWGTGAAWDTTPLADVGGEVAVDPATNVIEVSVPLELTGTSFRTYVATGLWTGDRWMNVEATRSETTAGGGNGVAPNVFNVAFRKGETSVAPDQAWQDGNFWFEREQAAALAAGDVSHWFADIDLTAADQPAPPPVGLNQIVHRAGATPAPHEGFVEHGVSANNEDPVDGGRGRGCSLATPPLVSCTAFSLVGEWQPYAVYVPPGGYERMVVLLHGGTYPLNYTVVPRIQQQLGDETRAVLVEPVAMGPASWFTDEAHLEVITSMRDAQERFAVDPTRTVVGGISMGGYGTNRLLVSHPDLFAGGILWSAAVGDSTHDYGGNSYRDPTGEGNGNPVDLVESMRNHRLQIIHAVGDQSALYPLVLTQTKRLDELGYSYELLSHLTWQHTTVFTANDWRRERDFILSVTGEDNPAHVSFATSEAWWRPEISPDLVFDRAYWVSEVRVRDTSAGLRSKGVVDARSRGVHAPLRTTEPIPESIHSGPPAPFIRSGRQQLPPAFGDWANEFSADLSNVRGVTFDLARMGLRPESPFRAELTTDGPAEIRLSGGAPLLDELEGAAARVDGDDLVVTLDDEGAFVLIAGEADGEDPPVEPPERGPAGAVDDCATPDDPGTLAFRPVPAGTSPTEVSTGNGQARAASPGTNSYYVVEVGPSGVRTWGRRDGATAAGEPERAEAHAVSVGTDTSACVASPALGVGAQGP